MPAAARRIDLANMRAHRRPRHARSSSHATGHHSPDHPGIRPVCAGANDGDSLRQALGRLDGHDRRRRRGRRRPHHVGRDGQRRGAGRRSSDRPAQVHRHPRPDRSPHAHHLLLGSPARHAPARTAPPAGGHRISRAGQRATHARDRRHDRSRSQRRQRHGSRHARAHRIGRDDRAAHLRIGSGPLGAAGPAARSRSHEASSSRIASRPAWTGSRSSARAAASKTSTARRP